MHKDEGYLVLLTCEYAMVKIDFKYLQRSSAAQPNAHVFIKITVLHLQRCWPRVDEYQITEKVH
jgi:hypothetical protein